MMPTYDPDKVQALLEEARSPFLSDDSVDAFVEQMEAIQAEFAKMEAEIKPLRNELARLRAILSTPGTDDFMRDVEIEAAHQIDRWGAAHDAGKEPADWFWLLGYLGGKALHDVRGKRAHHIVAAAACLLNWHRAVMGDSNYMRPGISPPMSDADPGAHGGSYSEPFDRSRP